MEDERKVSLDRYGIFDDRNLNKKAKKDSINDLMEAFEDYDGNGDVIKRTFKTTKTLEDGKKHVLKLEAYHEDKFRVEMLSLDGKEVFKWVYDKKGFLEEKVLNESLHTMRGIDEITVFTPTKYFICGNYKFPLQVVYKPNKLNDYCISKYDIRKNNLVKWSTFTKDHPKFEDKKIVLNLLEENRITQKMEEYIWNPELNSYEKWTYDKNDKLKEFEWKHPNNNESFLVKYDEKQKKVGLLYGNPNNKWTDKTINNIEFKDNYVFGSVVYFLLDKREKIKQEEEFKFELKYSDSDTKGLKR